MKCSATMQLYSYTGAIIFLLAVQHAFGAVPSFITPNPAGESMSIPETTPQGTQIYTIAANDDDDSTGASITYAIENQDPANRFTLTGDVLETASVFDYESEPTSYQLTFSATTINGSVTAFLAVNISDVNDEFPNITGPTTINIDEGQMIGTILATFTATDADENDYLRFSLSGDDIFFDIDAVSGEISNNQVIDYESATKTTFVLAITVRDAVSHSDTQLLTVNLQNINDNLPVFLDPRPDGSSIKSIPETTPIDTAIYTIVATDADGDSITYSITNQAPVEMFRLEERILYTNGDFDFEAGQKTFHLTLKAASAIDSVTTNLTITIEDVNDERPFITGQLSVDFDEGQPVGTTVLAGIVVNDTDVGDILTFSISGDDIYFDIDDRTGEITNNQVLDYESASKTPYQLTVTVRDAVGHSDSHSLTINLQNINDNPIVFLRPFPDGSSRKGILESTPTDTPIYTIEAIDADGDNVICSVTDQSPTVMFRLEGDRLYTDGVFDYETGPVSFHLTLKCHNAANVSDSVATNLTITIEDVNDEIPLISGKASVEFDEEQYVGTNVLAGITANDSDADDVLTYSIRGDDIFFRIDDRTGAISNSEILDYESASKTTFDLTVTVTDAVGHSDSRSLTINLRNINDNLPVFLRPLPDGTSRLHILETTTANTPIYTIEATDADGDNIVYSIIDQRPIARFRMEGQTIYTEGDFDFEAGETSFSLTISANSSDDTVTTDLTIDIDDVNDEIPVITGVFTMNINEEQPAGTVVSTGIVVNDADAGDTMKYSLSGEDIFFEIQDSSIGVITTNAKLDYETLTKTTFRVTLTVRDAAYHSATQLLTINLMNIDDNGPVFTNPLPSGASAKTLPETIAQGTSVYSITANDADGDTISYQMESQNPATPVRFTLISSDVRTTNTFDFETEPRAYTLTFSATSTNRTVTAMLTIQIEDVNDEKPFFTGQFTAEIEEEQPAGTTVPTTYIVTDTDADDVLSYSFIGGSSYFSIDSNGVITTTQVLDYETTTHMTFFLTISATDAVGQSATQAIAITLLNINDNALTFINPASSGGSSKTIPESTNVGTPIYTIEAEDSDVEEDGIKYFLVRQDPETPLMFNLDGRTLTTGAAFDYDEGPKSYRMTFNATSTFSSAGTSISESTIAVLTLIIQDVNDEPPVITGGPFNVTINEEQAIGSVIPLTLTVTDPDENDVLVYSLSGEDSNFEIDSATGMIRTKQVLDYETATQTTFTLTVTVTDDADHSATQQLTINLQNINDNTPEFSPNIYYVDVQENTTMGFDIVQLGVQDADQDAVTLNVASGDDSNIPKFMIADKTIQTSNSPIDFESLGGQNYEYTLAVTASDGTHTATATVHIKVTGQNEFDPVWSTFNRSPSLAENALIGTTIVTLSATDADEGSDGVISFSIDSVSSSPTGRTVDSLFHVDESSGDVTTSSDSFDADIATGGTEYYDIVVRATDGRGTDSNRRFIVETVRVALSDVNDNAPTFAETLVHVVISETDLPGVTIQELSANDEDQQSSLTYTLDTAASTPPSYADYFAIEETNKIKLQVIADLDYVGADDTFHLVVVAADGGNSALSGTSTVLVTITSVNEYAPVFTGPYTTTLPENADIDVTVVTVMADDGDSGVDGQVSYSITGDTDKQFSISPLTGVVKLAKQLDYETKTQYSLTVQATDGGIPSLDNMTTLTIDILDVDDNILTCDDTSIAVSISETGDANDVIASVSCTDLDESDTVVYSIKSGDSTVFNIDDASGQITLVRAVDYDNGDNFFILVIAVTSGNDNMDVSVSITVKPENEHAPVFNNPDVVTLPEDAEVGTTISALFATDKDINPHDIVRYTLNSVSNVGTSLFSISQSTGVIRLVDSLDYDTLPTPKIYVIVVWAIDGGSPAKTGSGTLTVSVTDVNDNIPVCSKYSYALTVVENEAVDSVLIADFGCSDADNGTMLQYTLSQNPPNHFRIDGTGSPQLLIDVGLDYDLVSSYTLIMSVSDGIHTTEVDIDIIIADINNGPPVFPQLQYSATVSEADSVGTSVITIAANDPDADTSQYGKLIYTFTVNMDSKFNIDPNFGTITVAGLLDADSVSKYNLVVQAADGGNLIATTTCNVTVLDVNDNKPTCSHYSFTVTIPESTIAPADIKTLSCSDKDITSNLQYAVSSGDTLFFQMNQNVLQLAAEIDYDVILSDVYSVTIDVSDGDSIVQISGLITITGVNEESPSFNQDTYQVNQAEDIPVGSTIATVTATDTDRGETVEYSLTPGVAEFKIEPFSGEIILLTELDRERDANYELFVQATDGRNSVTATVSITVIDVNDNTPAFNPTSYSVTVPENTAADQTVTTVTANDPDDTSGPGLFGLVQYALVDTFNAFAVDPMSGIITTTVEINYEDATFYALLVRAYDSNGGAGAKSSIAVVTIMVTGINEHDPVWVEFDPIGTSFTLPENSAIGTQIVTVSATDDDDGIHGFVLYSLGTITTSPTGRATTGLFHLDQVSGILTTTSNSFDRDIATGGTEEYDIEVRATDQGGLSVTQRITVTLLDVNDNAPEFPEPIYNVAIREDLVADTTINALTATDYDESATLTYILSTSSSPSSYDTYFSLEDGNTLKLKSTINLDPPDNAEDMFYLIVMATDGGSPALTGSATVIVSVTAVNEETPTFSDTDVVIEVSESVDVETQLQTMSASDNDFGPDGVVIYTITGGDPDKQFSVHRTTGLLKVAKTLDYETKNQFILTVKAADSGDPAKASTATVTINILDESDSEPECSETAISSTVPETLLTGDQIAILSCDDKDAIDTLEYSIKTGDSNVFQIGTDGRIALKRDLDYDIGDTFFALVINVQGGDDTIEVDVAVTVTAVNERPPIFAEPNVNVTLREDSKLRTTIATMEAQDEDSYPHSITEYRISSVSNGGNGLFSISKTSGTIALVGGLDYETLPDQKQYVIQVQAIDGGTPIPFTGTGTLTVFILDVNDNSPVCLPSSHLVSVAETAGIDTEVIADFGCTDADAGTTLTYTLLPSTINQFRLELSPQAHIRLNAALNYDIENAYQTTLSVSDGTHTTNINIDIVITEENNGGPVFDQPEYTGSVSESASIGTLVVTVSASDPDAPTSPFGKLQYTLTDNLDHKFNIDPVNGRITVAGELDAEEATEYRLVALVSETGGINSATVICVVTITDENDNDPTCTKYSFSVTMPETTTPPANLTTLSCSDRDITSALQFSISIGDTSLFEMNHNILQLITAIDYDTSPTDTFVVTVDVSDGYTTEQVSGIITIVGVNEEPPIFTQDIYLVSKPEDIQLGSIILKVAATDSDKGDTTIYSISSQPADDFSIDKNTGEIILVSVLDRETKASHELVVQATDGIYWSNATVIITVTDVNDNAPTFVSASYSATVPENTSPGHNVIVVSATDLDDPTGSRYGEVRYSIINSNDAFSIDELSGTLTTTRVLDYEETEKVYTVFVQATDSSGGAGAKSSVVAVIVKIGNENEDEPVFTRTIYATTVDENAAVGTLLATVSAIDSDHGDDGLIVYSMASHTYFYLNSKSGDITLKADLNYESVDKEFEFEVVARDSSTIPKSSTCTVSISVTDINDNNPKCEPNMHVPSFSEDIAAGTIIAQLSCSDADSDANADLLYTVDSVNSQPDDGTFAVDSQGRLTLQLGPLDYEFVNSYNILVKVSDNGNQPLSTTATVKIDITDVNEYTPEFVESMYTVSILENYISNISIKNVRATDLDIDNRMTYYINPKSTYFTIDRQNGDLFVISALDFENLGVAKSVEVIVYAEDNGVVPGPKSASTTVTITVQDANDGTPIFLQGIYYGSVSESSAAETTILRVEASDSDSDTLQYSLSNATNTFRIEQTGDIVLNDVTNLDYDSDRKLYSLTVHADDQRTGMGTTTVYITVTNENEYPPIYADFDRAVNVPEDANNNFEVLIISASDFDHGVDGDISYSILSGADGKFSVDPTSGRLTVSDALDREATPFYNLTISAHDKGTPQRSVEDTLTITVMDINDETPACEQQHYSVEIPEVITVGSQVVTLLCSDNDNDPNGLNNEIDSYLITAGNTADKFEILETGVVQIKGTVDREDVASYTLTVTVSDSGTPALTSTVTLAIQITDVNDNDPVFDEDNYSFSFNENAVVGDIVGVVHAEDQDLGAAGHIAYQIISGNDNGKFAIDEASGEVTLTESVDYDTNDKFYVLEIMAMNNDGSDRNRSVTVMFQVIDVNDNSPNCSKTLYAASVAENEQVTYSVVEIECTDIDTVTLQLSYAISFGNAGAFFAIGESSGVISVEKQLDAETNSRFDLSVDISDGTFITTAFVTVTVLDINEDPPIFSPVSPTLIREDTPVGSTVYALTATDDDVSDDNFIFSIVSGNADGYFAVGTTTGIIQLQQSVDREISDTYIVTFRVSDGTGADSLSSEIEMTFLIEDVNDNYPICDQSTYTFSVAENSSGHEIAFLNCNDADTIVTPQLSYRIISGNNEGKFALIENTGRLDLVGALDYESVPKYEIMCEVDDQGDPVNLITTLAIIVHVTPINEFQPEYVDTDTFDKYVEETTPIGTAITEIKATDIDKGLNHGVIRFSLASGNVNNMFAINSVTGWITLLKSLDYESIIEYSLTVTAKDSLGSVEERSADIIVHIYILDTNDNGPICSPSLLSETYDESYAANSPLAQFQCNDNDASSAYNSLDYEIVSINGQAGNSAQFFISFTGILTLVSNFDYEDTSSFNILVRISDNGTPVLSSTATARLSVRDVNEHEPLFQMSTYTVNLNEKTTLGTPIVTVSAIDADIDDVVMYSFEIENTHFDIDPVAGDIYLVSAIDYETMGSVKAISLTVVAKDSGINPGRMSSTAEVIISVINENDGTPTFVPGVYAAGVSENEQNEYTVITVTATDIDDADLNYFIVNGNEHNVYRIDKIDSKGVIVIHDNSLLDYEAATSYSLIIHAVDTGGLTGTTTVAIEVFGYNEFPPELPSVSSTQTVPENSNIGFLIIDLDASDADVGVDGDIDYKITSDFTGKFAADQITGQVTLAGSLDRETTDSYVVEITVSDRGATPGPLSILYTLTVIVGDVNDIPPVCSSSFYSATITENAGNGTSVAQLFCSDADSEAPNNQVNTFIITTGNDGGEFDVSTNGEVSVVTTLDYENKQYYELVVEVSDSGSPTLTTTTTLGITVTDENDNPPVFTENPYQFQAHEDTAVGSSVGTIIALDQDTNNAGELTYSIVTGNDDGIFALDRNTGILYIRKILDYDEDPKSYTIRVNASDKSDSPQSTISTIQFSILDVNDNNPVCTENLYASSIAEDAAFQTSILSVDCDDVDTVGVITYSVITGNIGDAFIIDQNNGDIFVAKDNALDAETIETYDLVIRVTDGIFDTNVTAVISVTDVNDNPPSFVPVGPYSINLSEDLPIGHTLMDLEASDNDISPTMFMFAIATGNEGGTFAIGTLSGVLQLRTAVDRENLPTPTYNLNVTVTDGSFTSTAVVFINVIDVNDNYPVCDELSYNALVPESTTTGETIFNPACSDQDSTTDLYFAIVAGNEEDKFLIDQDDGKVTLKRALDYEVTTNYFLTVTVSDDGVPALTSTLLMSVIVGAVNEHKPTFYGNFNVSLSEDAMINQAVVDLFANDSDSGLDHADITYAIKSGNNLGLFNVHPSTGRISVRGRLDYETATTHILTVIAADMSQSDPSRKTSEEALVIHLLDVNDNYPVFNPLVYAVEINEDILVGTTIVEISATDADAGLAGTDGLQFQIVQGNSGSVFSLSGSSIVLAAEIDADTEENYILTISASDQGTPALSSNTIVSLYVKAVNEHTPKFNINNDTVVVDEYIAVGDFVYQATATDDDTGIYNELRYYITAGNTENSFIMDTNSGIITVAKTLDFESQLSPYILILEVEDTHEPKPGTTQTGTMTLTVLVSDVNDETPIFSKNIYTPTLNENVPPGTFVTTVTATDRDRDQNGQISYTIVSGNGIFQFAIDSVNGIVSTANASKIDYETEVSYDLIIKAEDSGTPKRSSSCLVQVTVIDLNDEVPQFEVESFVTSITEQQPIDTPVTTVAAVDKDSVANNNNVFTYEFSQASPHFRIDQNTGEIFTTAILDRETEISYSVVVYAIDQGPNPNTGSTTVLIQLIDINDNPPDISGVYDISISEDAIPNTAVFLIVATDEDTGENGLLNYTITDGNIGNDFKIDQGTGNIQVRNTLDRERTEVYYLEITVTDGGGSNAIRSATVTLTDINDNPPIFDQTTYHFNVSEDVPPDTPVGQVTATDADIGLNGAIRYIVGSFIHGNSNHFRVDPANGVISTNAILDREVVDNYVFIYRAFDGGPNMLTATATVSITIGDFDDHLPEFGLSSYKVNTLESQPVGTSILTVVTSDKDFGPNAQITLTIDTKTTQGSRAQEFIAINSTVSLLYVKRPIDRETDPSFSFILIATDHGASPLTATTSVSIIVDDVNDERPAFEPTFYNDEIAYNDDCAVTVTTLTATDKDYGVNAEFNYGFTLNPYPHLFSLEKKSGAITLIATANPAASYVLYADAVDSGMPPLTSNGVTIRIDTFTPNEHVISFHLEIDEATYLSNEETFLRQLTTVFSISYSTSRVKRWCIETSTTEERLTTVHLYVIKDNLTDIESAVDVAKEFLTSAEAFAVVSADNTGTPSDHIKGSAWEFFAIKSVARYYVEETRDDPDFFDTAAGVAVIIIIVLLLVAVLTIAAIILMRKIKKDNLTFCFNQIEHGEDDAGDHVARNQYLTKTYTKKPLPPIIDYKSYLPPPVVTLPMPSSTKKVPMQVQNHIYEKPKDINIFNELIGFRPGSGAGTRLLKHPEKLRSGSPASIPELPPIRKLSSLISRPPSFAPMRDVSLREETPRELDESMRTIDDETDSLSTTKEFDGRAIDPVTGRVYEYSTRTHERRWVNESEMGSHFRLKADEK